MNKVEAIMVLFGAFPNAKPTKETYAAYDLVFADVPTDELVAVVQQALSNPQPFPPSAGELKELWLKAKRPDLYDPGAPARAVEAIIRAITGEGRNRTPVAPENRGRREGTFCFKDPITFKVASAMGWNSLCDSTTPMVDRAHIVKFYEAFRSGEVELDQRTPAYQQLVSSYAVARLEASNMPMLSVGEEY